jgi:hypothetical protein
MCQYSPRLTHNVPAQCLGPQTIVNIFEVCRKEPLIEQSHLIKAGTANGQSGTGDIVNICVRFVLTKMLRLKCRLNNPPPCMLYSSIGIKKLTAHYANPPIGSHMLHQGSDPIADHDDILIQQEYHLATGCADTLVNCAGEP